MNWIPLTEERRPAEGEHIWITGKGYKGRFYSEAVWKRGEWLMFDQEIDDHCHPCEYPTHWSPIEPPSEPQPLPGGNGA